MKRTIATLASLAVLATVGPIGSASAAGVVGQPSKFSDRFLTSLEEVDADSVAVVETNVDEEGTTNALMGEGDDRRRRLSWWSVVLMLLHPCDPNKDHCPHPHHPSGGDGGNGNNNSNGNSYDSNNSNADGSDGYSESDKYDAQKSNITPGTTPFALIIAAAAAAVAAMAALAVAAKRRRKPEYHQLRGSVRHRMKLFDGFANSCFEDRAVSGVQNAASEDGLQVV